MGLMQYFGPGTQQEESRNERANFETGYPFVVGAHESPWVAIAVVHHVVALGQVQGCGVESRFFVEA